MEATTPNAVNKANLIVHMVLIAGSKERIGRLNAHLMVRGLKSFNAT